MERLVKFVQHIAEQSTMSFHEARVLVLALLGFGSLELIEEVYEDGGVEELGKWLLFQTWIAS